jgi:hypothetical protein
MSSGEIRHFHTKMLQNYFVKNAEQKLKIFLVEKHIESFSQKLQCKIFREGLSSYKSKPPALQREQPSCTKLGNRNFLLLSLPRNTVFSKK